MRLGEQTGAIRRGAVAGLAVQAGAAAPALGHASEQGFVLLLPTDVYTAGGSLSVAATVVLLAMLPAGAVRRLFRPWLLIRVQGPAALRHAVSWLSFLLLLALIWAGLTGSRDPLVNPLPLAVWTIWWIGLVTVQGLFGDLWRILNPWTGPAAALSSVTGPGAPLRYPRRLGRWPAVGLFLCFAGFLLADPAPADPVRLARIVALYWLFAFAGIWAFGPRWLLCAEPVSVLMRSYARLAPLSRRGIGFWGWQVQASAVATPAIGVFYLVLLAGGSFDGLNETFWWLGLLNINPLEFPGRSAVIIPNLVGLLAASAALVAVFTLCVRLGLVLARSKMPLPGAFALLAPSILPIALGYHVAHYLPSLLVDGQYALAALSDPLSNGADLLGLGAFYVTTGFFNTEASVRAIFLTQAGAVIAGHILAVLLAHGLAVRAFGSTRRAALSQAPLAIFMICYTVFGLWLLASPRGA